MARSVLLDTRTINYLELVGNGKTYRVPPYQRDYSWSDEQWEDLWNDVEDLRRHPDRRHYLGALVVEGKTDREFLIIDGQQRLATLSALGLAVIARLETLADENIEPAENQERSRELRNRFIGEKDPASLVESSRLHLNATDDAFYQDYVIQLKVPRNPRRFPDSNHKLLKCFQYFVKRLKDIPELQTNGQALARVLSETVARQFLFILITVDDDLNAYTIFETLNARGLELTTTDLLKNYLLSRVRVSSDLEFLQRKWKSLIDTVGQRRFPEFLRYHLLCEHPKVRSQRLFKLVRNRIKTAENVFELLDDLESRAELYAAILDPSHGYWLDERPEVKELVQELNIFRTRQPMPLLFAAWDTLARNDFKRIFKLINVISFRYHIVSRLNTNALEPVFHKAAKALLDGKVTTPSAVFELLKPIYVEDNKMRLDFDVLEVKTKGSRRKVTKYILARLEEHYSNKSCNPETDPSTIEHILPENPGSTWESSFSEGQWENYVYRLGNLTLMNASANRAVGNSAYQEKVRAYESSAYTLTCDIAQMAPEMWTPELLEKRQRVLAQAAIHVWRSDFE